MAIARAALCEKHKPRVYQHECRQCKQEAMEATRKIYRPSTEEGKNETAADDSAVATEGE